MKRALGRTVVAIADWCGWVDFVERGVITDFLRDTAPARASIPPIEDRDAPFGMRAMGLVPPRYIHEIQSSEESASNPRWWPQFAVVCALGVAAIVAAAVNLPWKEPLVAEPRRAATSALSTRSFPQPRLSADDVGLQQLIAEAHSRGKESPELRAVIEQQGALATLAVSQTGCQGGTTLCAKAAELRESVLRGMSRGRVVKRLEPRDLSGSSWRVGLKVPEIPIEDDPRVLRQFQFYTSNSVGREMFQGMLFRCGAYRNLIHATLTRYGLPVDLFALVFAESSCEPRAASPAGAAGLWQLSPAIARAYHLRVVDGSVDERLSPPKSTDAAVRYLRDVHEKLGSWDLTFAAYNMGLLGVMARVEHAGGGDVGFWDLVDAEMLPDETANYAPAVQAIALILNNPQRLKFSAQTRPPQLTSDLEVPPGTRLSLIARAAATSVVQIHSLNLDIVGETTPNVPDFAVQVPADVAPRARDMLKRLLDEDDRMDLAVPPTFDWGRQSASEEMRRAGQPHRVRDNTSMNYYGRH